jgi:aryl-alcohol dehydrogenase-like predicted oxidoreductase
MQSLHHLVAAGKVLFLGISDSPAWVVSRANEYARNHGLTQFSVYQGQWNAGMRDFEQDIIPMARAENMALIPWGVLGSGQFKTEEQRQAKAKEGGRAPEQSEHGAKISRALEAVAKKHDAKLTAVALAYVMAKTTYVFPLIGCRTLEHLKGNIEALSLNLTEDDVKEIDEAAPFTPRFPSSFMYAPGMHLDEKNVYLLGMGGTIDHVPHVATIKPE